MPADTPAPIVGGKNAAGTYQRIISLIPPHDVYIEPFAGSGAILRRKRPAHCSVAVDTDPGAIDRLRNAAGTPPNTILVVGDGIAYLRALPAGDEPVFVYADPPYQLDTRRDAGRRYYGPHDWDHARHVEFLATVTSLPRNVQVMVSGYWSPAYHAVLAAVPGQWHTTHFTSQTRGGPAEEWLWMNYPPPTRLHDYRYIGADFPQRWRIHKRQRSWLRMLRRMPELERRAMLAAIFDAHGDEVLTYLAGGARGHRPPRR